MDEWPGKLFIGFILLMASISFYNTDFFQKTFCPTAYWSGVESEGEFDLDEVNRSLRFLTGEIEKARQSGNAKDLNRALNDKKKALAWRDRAWADIQVARAHIEQRRVINTSSNR